MKYVILLVGSIFLLPGCIKIQEHIDYYRPQQPTTTACRLDSLYPVSAGNPALDRTTAIGVHYNGKGNPIVVNYTFDHYGTFKFPVIYKYDEMDRLIEVLPVVDSTIPDYLNGKPVHTKYVYEGNSLLPMRDTIFREDVEVGNEVEELYYDDSGRVNRVFRRFTLDASYDLETGYEYDANGNKQVTRSWDGSTPPPIQYTDKPSLYSLHSVWRIIHKDYSKNSLASSLKSVTEQGLPESLYFNNVSGYYGYEVHDAASPFTLFLGVESGIELRFTYTCSTIISK